MGPGLAGCTYLDFATLMLMLIMGDGEEEGLEEGRMWKWDS